MTPKARKRKAPDEPVCIAISSDEEDVDEIDAEAGDKGNDDGGQSNGRQSFDNNPCLSKVREACLGIDTFIIISLVYNF